MQYYVLQPEPKIIEIEKLKTKLPSMGKSEAAKNLWSQSDWWVWDLDVAEIWLVRVFVKNIATIVSRVYLINSYALQVLVAVAGFVL